MGRREPVAEPIFARRGAGKRDKPPSNKKCDATELALLMRQGLGVNEITRRLDCKRETINRCCRDNKFPTPGSKAAMTCPLPNAKAAAAVPGSIEATGGRYAELEVFAKKNKLTLMQAQQRWHRRPRDG